MKLLLLRLMLLITSVCMIFCLLALGIGGRRPNTVAAYSEACPQGYNFVVQIVVVDVRPVFPIRFALPQETAPAWSPSWSPDGTQIAYTANIDGRYVINILDFKSGSAHHLPADPFNSLVAPSWSPNGHFIVFFLGGQAAVVDTRTNRIQRFPLQMANSVYATTWSPDGNALSFWGFYPQQHPEIYILNVETGDIQDFTRAQFDVVNYPAWSPDGRYMTFTASDLPAADIYLADMETNTISQLSKDDGSLYVSSVWSPDGQTVAAITTGAKVNVFDLSGNIIREIDLQPMLGTVGGESLMRWSPNGTYLAVNMYVDEQWRNYIYDLSSDTFYPLSPKPCLASSVAWRPD